MSCCERRLMSEPCPLDPCPSAEGSTSTEIVGDVPAMATNYEPGNRTCHEPKDIWFGNKLFAVLSRQFKRPLGVPI